MAAGAEDEEDGVHADAIGGAGPSAAGLGGEMGLDQGPLGVGEVTGIVVRSHTPTPPVTPQLFALWDSHLVW